AEFLPASPSPVFTAAFSRNVARLATYHGAQQLWIWETASGKGRRLDVQGIAIRDVDLSADGAVVAAWGEEVVLFPDGAAPRVVSPGVKDARYIAGALSPDAKFLALVRETELDADVRNRKKSYDLCFLDGKTVKELKKFPISVGFGPRV